jgi:hypothetical protein
MQLKMLEMFAISRIVGLPKTLGERTVLSSFTKEFMKEPDFKAFLEARSGYEQEVLKVTKKHETGQEALLAGLKGYSDKKVSEVPEELKIKAQTLNNQIQEEMWNNTTVLRAKMEELITSPKDYEVEVTEKMKEVFKAFMEDKAEIKDLKINEFTIQTLISIYQRF